LLESCLSCPTASNCSSTAWYAAQDMQDDMADLLEDMNEIQEIMGRSYGYAPLSLGSRCSPWTDVEHCAALAPRWTRASWRPSSRALRRSGRPRRRVRPPRRSRRRRTWPLVTTCRPRRPGPWNSPRAGRPTSSGCPLPPAYDSSEEERASKQVVEELVLHRTDMLQCNAFLQYTHGIHSAVTYSETAE